MRILVLLILLVISHLSYGIETNIVIRVKARDAKFVGSSIGGALVMVRDQMTGELLAEGLTEGATGNTDLIMKTPWTRHERLTDEKTAKFLAMIDIDEPTLVTIEIQSPVNSRQALIHASTELWIIPGKDILGDGIIVEIPGFVVELLKPRTHQYVSLDELKDGIIEIQANVVMMCGCPISKDGIWDSQKIEVMAIIKKDGNQVETMPLEWVADNLFEASFPTDEKGQYEVIVYAFDGMTGNTGVDKVNYIIR